MTFILYLLLQMAITPGRAQSYVPPTGCVSGACSDAFAGTNGTALATHDANWVDVSSPDPVASIELRGSNTAGFAASANPFNNAGAAYNISTADTSQITMVANSRSAATFVCVRCGGGSSGYGIGLSTVSGGNFTHLDIGRNGGFLASPLVGSWATASSHTLKVSISGTTITATVDGVSAGTFTDGTPLAAGHPGFFFVGDGSSIAPMAVTAWQDH